MKETASHIASAVLGLLLAFAVTAGPAPAQVHVGPQLSYGENTDLGVGVRAAVYDLGDSEELSNWEGVGSFDYFFPGGGVDYLEVNLNALYNFSLGPDTPLHPYLGAGMNVARASVDDGPSDSDLGLNLVGGWKYQAESVTPFAEVRIEVGGGEQFVVTGGFLLP